jgi:hypothetical protein
MGVQLYGHGRTAPSAEKRDRSFPGLAFRKAEGLFMKRIVKTSRAPTDDAYYVSAADVADKLLDRMRRGLDPLLLSWDLFPAGLMSRTVALKEFD